MWEGNQQNKNMKKYNERTVSKYDFIRSGHLLERRFEIVKNLLEKFREPKTRPLEIIGEIGSGPGRLSYLLANYFKNSQIETYDANEKFIDYAKKNFSKENLNYQILDIEKTKLPKEVDFLVTIDILHHLNNLDLAIKNITDSIKKNGGWVVVEHNIYNPYIFLFQLLAKNEGLFSQSYAEKLFLKYFQILEKKYALLIHSFIKNPPNLLKYFEKKLENNKILGGSVIYFLKK